MRIDLHAPHQWNDLNEKYRALLGIEDASVYVQVYAGYQHALWEATNALARLFQHKKNIAFAPSIEASFEPLAAEFSEREFKIKNLNLDDLKNPASLNDVMTDLLFVVAPEDDAVTGKVYDLSGIESALMEKRVFRVVVSHAAFRAGKIQRPHPFEVRILSLAPDFAVVVAGERSRLQPLLAPRLAWNRTPAQTEILIPVSWREKIESFEGDLPKGFKAYFQSGESRIFDRVVIVHPDLDGSAVVDELARLTKSAVEAPGVECSFETTSSCRWTSPRLTEYFLNKEGSEERVRGLVMIAANRIDSNLKMLLQQTAETLLRQQNG